MSIVFYDPCGDEHKVATLSQAYAFCAQFVRAAEVSLGQIETAADLEDRSFMVFDEVEKNWNYNVSLITWVEADPQYRLKQKKADYRAAANEILRMAKACSEDPAGSSTQRPTFSRPLLATDRHF